MRDQSQAVAIRRERTWQAVSTASGILGAMVAKQLLRRAYRAVRKQDPDAVFDPSAAGFSWGNAVMWATAAGIGLVIAKIVSDRIAAIGWRVATGTLPPGATR